MKTIDAMKLAEKALLLIRKQLKAWEEGDETLKILREAIAEKEAQPLGDAEELIMHKVHYWYDSQETDAPQEMGALRSGIREVLCKSEAQTVEPVAYLLVPGIDGDEYIDDFQIDIIENEASRLQKFLVKQLERGNVRLPLFTHPAPATEPKPALSCEREALIERLQKQYDDSEADSEAANIAGECIDMLAADAPMRDKQWHDTAWQRGFQAGVNSNEETAKNASAALEAEKVAHRETNRMMTEALIQAEEQQVAVPQDAARLEYLISNRAYVVSDATCCDGFWLHYAQPDGSTWVQATEHATPYEAIDAAMGAMLAAAPQPPQAAPRVPMTVQEVEQIIGQWSYEIHGDRSRYLVRMAEGFHGIGVKP